MKSKNGEKLYELIQRHGLTRPEVAEILGLPVTTIHNWLRPVDNAAHRDMSDQMLELLELKLK